MYESTIARYSFLDDLLKALNHREDGRQKVSDAQVITTAVIAARYFGGNFDRASLLLFELGWYRARLHRSRFSRRLRRLADTLQLLFLRVGSHLKQLNLHSRYLLDSFPVALCDNIRINGCRMTEAGLPVEIAILPGSCSDQQGIGELAFDLPPGAQVFPDAGYTEYQFEDFLFESQEVKLMIARKRNSTRLDEPRAADFKQMTRKYIETVIGEINKMFPKKIHSTDLDGFLLKILLFIFAFQLDKAFLQ